MGPSTFEARLPLAGARRLPTGYLTLVYRGEPCSAAQKHVQGRLELVPDIDLTRYREQVLVDYVTLRLSLAAPQHRANVRRVVVQAGGEGVYVDRVGQKAPFGRNWLITMQTPSGSVFRAVVDALDKKWPLAEPTVVHELELSLDLYPTGEDEDGRRRMVGVLQRHLLPDWEVLREDGAAPRSAFTKREGGPTFVEPLEQIPGPLIRLKGNPKRLDPDGTSLSKASIFLRSPYANVTYQLGKYHEGLRWRVQDKTTDRRRSDDGSYVALKSQERRARIEVTLSLEILSDRKLKLDKPENLTGANLAKLKGRFLPFYLATVPDSSEKPVNVKDVVNGFRQRREVAAFSERGVIGVRELLEEGVERARASNNAAGSEDKQREKSGRTKLYRAPGKRQSLVAWGEMNKKVRNGFKRFTRDWDRG